jgi:hypothetical protein
MSYVMTNKNARSVEKMLAKIKEDYEEITSGIRYYPKPDIFIIELSNSKGDMQAIYKSKMGRPLKDVDRFRDTYTSFLRKVYRHEDKDFADMYINIVHSTFPSDLWTIDVYGTEIEDQKVQVATKKETSTVRVRSFKVCHGDTKSVWRADIEVIFALCQNKINLGYLVDGMRPSRGMCIMLTVIEQVEPVPADRLRGIRISHLRTKTNPIGVYMCSDGLGTFLQEHTEELLRKRRHSVYELYAVRSAVGFWERVGFTPTGKMKHTTVHMSKTLKAPTPSRSSKTSRTSSRQR